MTSISAKDATFQEGTHHRLLLQWPVYHHDGNDDDVDGSNETYSEYWDENVTTSSNDDDDDDEDNAFIRNMTKPNGFGIGKNGATSSNITHNTVMGWWDHHAETFKNNSIVVSSSNQGDDASMTNTTMFDPKVFWSVNAFIFVLVVTTCGWCWWGDKYGRRRQQQQRDQQNQQRFPTLSAFTTMTASESDEIYRRAVLERRERQAKAKIDTPEQRTKKLLKSFGKNQVRMTVKEDDLIDDEPCEQQQQAALEASEQDKDKNEISTTVSSTDTDESDENGNANHNDHNMGDIETGSLQDEETGHLKLGNGTLVPNCCAICLTGYEVGDTVIWSSNPDCAHAFHQDCVVGWLVKMQPETPCPCCRQEFTDLEAMRKESKIKWDGSNAFNLEAVRIR
mmetsp:Transcript_9740/g.17159  ORF Transcript_9740/g.17159 Transcript_9740/m.17159 type:complete len:394 (+) Transcript_9740:194-1375(+)